MDPMDLAVRLVLSMGGANAFLNKRYSQERKFILEQSVCVEIIGEILRLPLPLCAAYVEVLWSRDSMSYGSNADEVVEPGPSLVQVATSR